MWYLNFRMREAPRIPYGSCSDNRRMSAAAEANVAVRPTKAEEAVEVVTSEYADSSMGVICN